MSNKVRAMLLCIITLGVLMAGCAPSRTYREGVLATEYRSLATEDLRSYASRLDEEIARVEKGGAVPAGVSREEYLRDLKSRRYEVKTTIAGRDLLLQDERRQRMELQRPLP